MPKTGVRSFWHGNPVFGMEMHNLAWDPCQTKHAICFGMGCFRVGAGAALWNRSIDFGMEPVPNVQFAWVPPCPTLPTTYTSTGGGALYRKQSTWDHLAALKLTLGSCLDAFGFFIVCLRLAWGSLSPCMAGCTVPNNNIATRKYRNIRNVRFSVNHVSILIKIFRTKKREGLHVFDFLNIQTQT